MNLFKQIWDVNVYGELNFLNIRKLYPDKGYRLAENQYAPGEKHHGIMKSGRWFIIAGMAQVRFKSEQILKAGQIVEMPSGEYEIEVIGSEPFHYVVAWELPPPFNKNKTVPNKGHFDKNDGDE